MADDYLEFSQVVANLSQQEADWLCQELAMIDVYGDQEFGAGTGNVDGKLGVPDWSGFRFLRDYPDLADLAKLGHFIQRFLRRFRPHDCWALSYACTCSKPRVDAFGGGAVFITSRRITFDSSWDLIERKRQAFERRRQQKPRPKKRTRRKP